MTDWQDIESRVAGARIVADPESFVAFDAPGETMVPVFHRPTQRTVVLDRAGHDVLAALGELSGADLALLQDRFPGLHRRRLLEILITLREHELASLQDRDHAGPDPGQP